MNDGNVTDRLDRLETLVEKQQEEIEKQRDVIEHQRNCIEELNDDDGGLKMDRRTALQAGGIAGLIGIGGGVASAAPSGQVGTQNKPTKNVYTESIDGGLTGGTEIGDLLGFGLGVYGSEPSNLRVQFGDTNDLSQSGSIDRISGGAATSTIDTLDGNGLQIAYAGTGDELQTNWDDAAGLDSSGVPTDFSNASSLNADGSVNFAGVQVYLSSTQEISDGNAGTWVDVGFDSVVADDVGNFSSPKYEIPLNGDYLIDFDLNLQNLTGSLVEARVRTTGGTNVLWTTQSTPSGQQSIGMSKVVKGISSGTELKVQLKYDAELPQIIGGSEIDSSFGVNRL